MKDKPRQGLWQIFRIPNWAELSRLTDTMSLKTRVVVLVFALLLAAIWVLAFSVTLVLQHDLEQLQSARLSAEVANVADDIDRDVKLHIDALARLAASLTPDILADAEKLESALDRFSDTSVIVPAACFVANEKGIVTAGYPAHAVSVGASVADSVYFRQAIASGKPLVGSPLLTGTAERRPAVPIAVPLRNGSGASVGALIGMVLLTDPNMLGPLQRMKIGASGAFLVASPRDRVILAAPEPTRILQQLPPKGALSHLDRRLDEGFEAPSIVVTAFGVEQLSAARKIATTGWVVLGGVPTKEVFAPIEDIKRGVYFAALLVSLAVAVILRFFLGRQFAPLKQAEVAIRRMTEGEIPMASIPVTRHDEIGGLIANFNRLVAERSRLEASLRSEIAQRIEANNALRESKDRLDGIYQSVGEGIISIDKQQRIVLFNAAAERIFGYSAAAMIGQPLNLLLPERFRPRHEEQVRQFDASGENGHKMGAYRLIQGLRASGEEFPIEAAVSFSGASSSKLFTVILRDITERRQAEQERDQLMRQLESLSEYLARAHEEARSKIAFELHEELGQELTTLKFYLQMLGPGNGDTAADAHHKEALAVAVHATERIRKLVLNLEPQELSAFGLHAAVRTYCQGQAAAGGWALHIDAPAPETRAPRAVERACFHVLQEGLSNVIQYARASEVWVDVSHSADELELRLRDNGIGFDRDADDDEIMHNGGHLGLFGMQLRAKQVGGAVEITSSPGKGTLVRAVFPLPATD